MAIDQDQKKVWAGLKRTVADLSEIDEDIRVLKENGVTWSDYTNGANNNSTFSGFNTFLTNQGLTQTQADRHTSRLQNEYADYTSFSGDLSNYDSYQEFKRVFTNHTNLGGESTAGVKVYREAGIGMDGQSIPKDGLELRGVEIHTSEAPPSSAEASFDVTNFTTDDADNTVTIGNSITLSVDVSNTTSIGGEKTITLTEDGAAVDSKTEFIFGNNSTTISFTVTKEDYICHDYSIEGLGPETVCWVPGSLQL